MDLPSFLSAAVADILAFGLDCVTGAVQHLQLVGRDFSDRVMRGTIGALAMSSSPQTTQPILRLGRT